MSQPSPDGNEEKARLLCEACSDGKIDVVKELVEKHNTNPNYGRDEEGRSPLQVALYTCLDNGSCAEIALYLINCGCGGEADKALLMYYACYSADIHYSVVKGLVEEHNIDPLKEVETSWDGEKAPLTVALEWYNCEAALYLINRGCGGDEEKAKLLCTASIQGQIDVVKEVVEKHNVDPRIARDETGRAPFDLALDSGNSMLSCEVALYLINRGCGGDEEKARLLFEACYRGEIDVVKELVEKHKIDPNVARDGDGRTPLDRALVKICVSSCEVALYLTNLGCGGDEEKAKLLCRACFCGKIDIVKELVEKHKMDPNSITDDNVNTPLDIAMEHNCTTLVDYLKSLQFPATGSASHSGHQMACGHSD